ncbi:g5154 [Coccomyxa elongata]
MDRVVQIITQTEEGTLIPRGTGALILKDIIVTARHTVVDSDGVYVNPFVDGQKVEFLIASPVADLALLKLPEPRTVRPFRVGISSELKVRKQVAVLGYPLGAEPNMDSKPMLRQDFPDTSGAAVLYDRDTLAGFHIDTMNHPDAANRPLPIPSWYKPHEFETSTEQLWASSTAAFDVAEAKSIQESHKTKYPGDHSVIVPAHHIWALLEEAGLISRDPLRPNPKRWHPKRTRGDQGELI